MEGYKPLEKEIRVSEEVTLPSGKTVQVNGVVGGALVPTGEITIFQGDNVDFVSTPLIRDAEELKRYVSLVASLIGLYGYDKEKIEAMLRAIMEVHEDFEHERFANQLESQREQH